MPLGRRLEKDPSKKKKDEEMSAYRIQKLMVEMKGGKSHLIGSELALLGVLGACWGVDRRMSQSIVFPVVSHHLGSAGK